jgi:hypothetical protein
VSVFTWLALSVWLWVCVCVCVCLCDCSWVWLCVSLCLWFCVSVYVSVSVWLCLGARIGNYSHYLVHSTFSATGAKAVFIMHGYFPPRPAHKFVAWCCITHWTQGLWKRHSFFFFFSRSVDQSVLLLFISQHDVSFELATPLPRTLPVTDICNKTYGNLLCVATGCSSCKNSLYGHVEKLYTGLVSVISANKCTYL